MFYRRQFNYVEIEDDPEAALTEFFVLTSIIRGVQASIFLILFFVYIKPALIVLFLVPVILGVLGAFIRFRLLYTNPRLAYSLSILAFIFTFHLIFILHAIRCINEEEQDFIMQIDCKKEKARDLKSYKREIDLLVMDSSISQEDKNRNINKLLNELKLYREKLVRDKRLCLKNESYEESEEKALKIDNEIFGIDTLLENYKNIINDEI